MGASDSRLDAIQNKLQVPLRSKRKSKKKRERKDREKDYGRELPDQMKPREVKKDASEEDVLKPKETVVKKSRNSAEKERGSSANVQEPPPTSDLPPEIKSNPSDTQLTASPAKEEKSKTPDKRRHRLKNDMKFADEPTNFVKVKSSKPAVCGAHRQGKRKSRKSEKTDKSLDKTERRRKKEVSVEPQSLPQYDDSNLVSAMGTVMEQQDVTDTNDYTNMTDTNDQTGESNVVSEEQGDDVRTARERSP
ncbi:unnamed protein product [Bursaphelenchus okinawaensis]|uniref:Uncharacterized protein n=1 Tax=Bursaphelenchus okinawaensis TaxID=465554 RepID=A0A811K2Q1_9BILA|nr:unnamed protein product [Bursaphelenchus okinawaensis]CAG9089861.1 unnamed protein product [Bursaphelenchus okinawaensis]